MVLKLPQSHEDSEYVLSFEIGQREGGFYSARTDRHTDRHIEGENHTVTHYNTDYSDFVNSSSSPSALIPTLAADGEGCACVVAPCLAFE